jgi:hypothetical protein
MVLSKISYPRFKLYRVYGLQIPITAFNSFVDNIDRILMMRKQLNIVSNVSITSSCKILVMMIEINNTVNKKYKNECSLQEKRFFIKK